MPRSPKPPRDAGPLSPKRERFCQEYVANGSNGAQAAVAAGYAKGSAKVTASQLLTIPNVRDRVADLAKAAADRLDLKADDVIREAMRLAFSDLGQFAKWNGGSVRLTDSTKLSEALTRCVAEVAETKTGVKIKLHNKVDALDKLFRHLGLYVDKMDLTSGGEPVKQVVVIAGQRIEF